MTSHTSWTTTTQENWRSKCPGSRSACEGAGSPADGTARNVRSEVLRDEQCAANLGLCNVIRAAIKAFRDCPPQHARNCWCLLARRSLAAQPLRPVSYTHLRAHETGRNLVCRL